MEQQLEKIRDVQREAWNKSSSGWKKYDAMMMKFLEPINDEMIRMLGLQGDEVILDIATGTGEPALTIAKLLNKGKVIGNDLSQSMLDVAMEKAEQHNITNFETSCSDVSELNFDDNSFDAVTCRLGFMFFPDIKIALNEMVRVLKPGGKIVVSVWGNADKNFWIRASMETMISQLSLQSPAPGAPGLFRCSEPDCLTNYFLNTGLTNVQENQVSGKLKCLDIENYWNFITDVASPMAFSKADQETQQMIREEVLSKILQKCSDNKIELESFSVITEGQKP